MTAARKVMGQAIGRCAKLGKEKPFKEYIHLERQLGEVDRCRTLYTKYLEAVPTNCAAWGRFAALESALGETARSRAVFEIAVNQVSYGGAPPSSPAPSTTTRSHGLPPFPPPSHPSHRPYRVRPRLPAGA